MRATIGGAAIDAQRFRSTPRAAGSLIATPGALRSCHARTDFIKLGEDGKPIGSGVEGCKGYLKWAALHQSRTFLGLLGRILPYYIKAELPENAIMTHEETLAQLRERGLPENFIELMRKAPVVLDPDEEIDPYRAKDVTPDV